MVDQGSRHPRDHDPLEVELDSWIASARLGDREALGKALSSFRNYLMLVANEELEPDLKAKEGASDLVQETFLRAQRKVAQFNGRSPSEWRQWLKSILLRHAAKQRRRFQGTAKRRIWREVPIACLRRFDHADGDETPSRDLLRREREVVLMEAVALLPDHYREVVIWHHREKLAFEEIGRRRGISAEAARKLWSRALSRLRKAMESAHDFR
jgi:RNA polymerase sigma-70 factor (ECF subfamily)